MAYGAAGIIEHGAIVSKLGDYANQETDPVARMSLATDLNEAIPQQEPGT